MSSEPTVLSYMPLVVSSEFGKSAQFIIPVKKLLIIYTLSKKRNFTLLRLKFTHFNAVIFLCVHEGRPSDKTTVKKCFEIDQA